MKEKLIPILMTMALAVFAEVRDDIDVVPCEKIVEDDKVPDKMMPADVDSMLRESPDDWVCFYDACDFKHADGWTAVHKFDPLIFIYKKDGKKITATRYEEVSAGGTTALCHQQFDKYGVNTGGCNDLNIELFKRVLLTDDVICTKKRD